MVPQVNPPRAMKTLPRTERISIVVRVGLPANISVGVTKTPVAFAKSFAPNAKAEKESETISRNASAFSLQFFLDILLFTRAMTISEPRMEVTTEMRRTLEILPFRKI